MESRRRKGEGEDIGGHEEEGGERERRRNIES